MGTLTDQDRTDAAALPLIARTAALLIANGQTTEGTHRAVARLGASLACPATFEARWGQLTFRTGRDGTNLDVFAEPMAIDIGRVQATERIVDGLCEGRLSPSQALPALDAVATMPPVSIARFATMAGAGAAALGIIFGAADWLTLALIAGCAGAGAVLRRAVSHRSRNPFVQPFVAALLAGSVGSVVAHLGFDTSIRLVTVCPCMVLVPGPHFLNGMIDLARARIPLGAARIAFAALVVLAISTGLLAGLVFGTGGLPRAAATAPVALAFDVAAAGIAISAYGSFFNMPWKMMPAPIVIGMVGHAVHWELLRRGASLPLAALGACLPVGVFATPCAHWLRMPFGAFAFAAVVSLIPGIFMFEAAAAAVALIGSGAASVGASPGLLADAAVAALVLLAMTLGLIVPKMLLDGVFVDRQGTSPT